MTKSYIQKVLRLNGISADVAQDEIEELLKTLSWDDEKIKYALVLIKETEVNESNKGKDIETSLQQAKEKHVDNDNFTSEKIRSLLNIELDASVYDLKDVGHQRRTASLGQIIKIIFLILVFAMLMFVFVSWYYGIDVMAHV